MKRLLLIFPALLLLLASCDTSDVNLEKHEFHPSCDETHHFEECECGERINEVKHEFTNVLTIDATCTTDGLAKYKCACGYEYEETIEALGHNPSIVNGKDATCQDTGLTDGTICSTCGVTLKEQESISKTNHSYTEWVIDTPATCIAKGKEKRECEDCDLVEYRDTVIINHTPVEIESVESTCITHGHTAGSYCGYCKKVLVETEELPLKEHKFSEWDTITPATCVSVGSQKRVCECGKEEYQELSIKSHDIITIPATESTCTTHGNTVGTYCDYCKKVFVETDELPLEDHNYGEYQEVTKATCISKGMDKRICSECGHEDFKETDILKHNYITTEAVPSTCTIQGHTAGSYCSTCGKVETAEELLPLANHSYPEEYTVIKDATYISNGSAYYKCNNCEHAQNVEIPKLIFTKSNWQSSFNTTLASNTTIEMTFYDDALNKDLTIKMINYSTKYYISIKDNNTNIITYYYYSGTVAYQSLDDGYKHMTYVSSDDMYKKYLNILINSVYYSSEAYSITSEITNGLTAYGTSKSYKNTISYGTTTIKFNEKAELISLDLDYSSIKITANISYSSSDIALPYANYHDFAKGETCSQCSKTCDSYSAHKNNFTVYYHVMDSTIQFEYEMDNDNVTPCIFENPTMTKSTTEDIITFTQNYKDSNGVSQILYIYVVGGEVICGYDSDNLASIIGALYMSETDAGIKPDGSLEQIYFQVEDDLSIKVYYKGISDSLIEYEGIVTNIIGTKDEYYIIFENTANFLSYKIKYDGNIEISYA